MMAAITGIRDAIGRGRPVPHHRPWPRAVLTPDSWRDVVGLLGTQGWSLLGLWGDRTEVHMALSHGQSGEIAVASLDCPDRSFPSVARTHPPALRLEATIHD